MTAKKKWNVYSSALLAALLAACLILILYRFLPFIYDSVDDMATRDMLFGNYTGKSDGHLLIQYPLSWLLTVPFRLLPGFDWYGAFLIGLSWLSLTLVLFRVLDRNASLASKAFQTLLVLLGFLAIWTRYLTVFIFTVTAALAGSVIVFWFLTIDFKCSRKRIYLELALTAALALLVLCLRYEVFCMTAAVALVCFIFRAWQNPDGKKPLIRGLLLPLLAGALLFTAADIFIYTQDGWDGYLIREQYRSQIFDFYGLPDYDENQDFYASIGFGREEYEAFETNPLFIHDKLTVETVKAIADKAKELDTRSFGERLMQSLRLTWENQVWDGLMPLNLIHGLFWLLICFTVIRQRNRPLGLFCLSTAFMYLLLWLYLGYEGRVPERVGVSMHLLGMLTLAGLWTQLARSHSLPRLFSRKAFLGIALAAFGVTAWYGVNKAVSVNKEFHSRVPQYRAIVDYCQAHPDNFYVIDLIALTNYTEPYYLRTVPASNFIKAGGPAVYTPIAMEKVARHGSGDFHEAFLTNPDMYVISANEDGLSYIEQMYARQYPDFTRTLVDVIRWGADQSYVYQYSLDASRPRPLSGDVIDRLVPHENGFEAGNVLDGDFSTCWTTGVPQNQQDDTVFDIVLKETTQLSGIWLSVGDFYSDYPRDLRIFATADGENWSELAVENTAGIYFSFETTPVKELRLFLENAPETDTNWSIAELTLYQ